MKTGRRGGHFQCSGGERGGCGFGGGGIGKVWAGDGRKYETLVE